MKVFDLELLDSYYYIKRNTIVEKIHFNNRTFYAKFERINETLTPLLLSQHHQKEYTIAVPLVYKNRVKHLVIEYKGEEYKRFVHLVKHLFKSLGIDNYALYEGKEAERIQVYIGVDNILLQEANERLNVLSNALQSKMTKNWKLLPQTSLPDDYNIITLPYKKI